jgi:hypothetical protein
VTLQLAGLGEYSYDTVLQVRETGDAWRVAFTSATLHPALGNGQRLDRRRGESVRGRILDRAGREVRAGSVDLAANVLGTVGPATEPTGQVLAGEPTGLTGLERVLNEQLAGSAGGAVVVADAASGAEVEVLQEFPGAPGQDVTTALDLDVQSAAEQAIGGLSSRAALVAIDTATGEVRAVANSPVAGVPATFASYAPGSVFKVVTATAALMEGTTPDTVVDCPATISVGGRSFRNDEGLVALGAVPFRQAFANSCNTTLIGLSRELPEGALQRAAELYGFGREDLLPIKVEGGQFPAPESDVEAAAGAIGQGRVEASPLLVAGHVRRGGQRHLAAAEAGARRGRQHAAAARGGRLAARDDARRRHLRHREGCGAGRPAGPRQDGHGPVRQRRPAADPRLVHRIPRRPGVRRLRENGASGGSVSAPAARRFLAALPG